WQLSASLRHQQGKPLSLPCAFILMLVCYRLAACIPTEIKHVHQSIYIPDDFINLIRQILPDSLDMDSFLTSCRTPLRRSIRVNTLKISVADFLAKVSDKDWTLTPAP